MMDFFSKQVCLLSTNINVTAWGFFPLESTKRKKIVRDSSADIICPRSKMQINDIRLMKDIHYFWVAQSAIRTVILKCRNHSTCFTFPLCPNFFWTQVISSDWKINAATLEPQWCTRRTSHCGVIILHRSKTLPEGCNTFLIKHYLDDGGEERLFNRISNGQMKFILCWCLMFVITTLWIMTFKKLSHNERKKASVVKKGSETSLF